MGDLIDPYDDYIPCFLAKMNLYFAPAGAIEKMVRLQKKEGRAIFKKGRSFKDSVALLKLDLPGPAERAWLFYLEKLDKKEDVKIVEKLVDHLLVDGALPVHFMTHESNPEKQGNPMVDTHIGHPTFYIEEDYLLISLPMTARKKNG